MNLKNIFQKTWSKGLLLFSIVVLKKNNKTIEVGSISSEEKDGIEEIRIDKD